MGLINNVIDSLDGIANAVFSDTIGGSWKDVLFNGGKIKYKSIESASKDLVAIFPNIVDRTLNKDIVEKINKSIEYKNANLLRLLLSNIIMNSSDVRNSATLLRKVHKNFDGVDFLSIDLSESTLNGDLESNYDLSNYEDSEFINENSLNNYYLLNGDIKKFTDLYNENLSEAVPFNPQQYRGKDKNVSANKFSDSECRNINNLAPLMIELNVPVNKLDALYMTGILLGVKSKIYPASSSDIIEQVTLYNKGDAFSKFIQLSTGEIKFWKDFVFNMNKIKSNLIDNKESTSTDRLWKVLKRRSSKHNKSLMSSMKNAAIASLTLSIDTVNEIKANKNIDLLDVKQARKFMDLYSVMNLVIVDEADEICYFISDSGDDIFTELTFSFISKELSELSLQKPVKRSISIFG